MVNQLISAGVVTYEYVEQRFKEITQIVCSYVH
jgi:hypothetical protein